MQIIRPKTYTMKDTQDRRFVEDIYKLTNKNISFGHQVQYLNNVLQADVRDQNIDGVLTETTSTGTANTQFTVIHNLGRVPLCFDLKYINGIGTVYASAAFTANEAFFKCTLANAHIRLFIH